MIFASWELGWEPLLGMATLLAAMVGFLMRQNTRITRLATNQENLEGRVERMGGVESLTKIETEMSGIKEDITKIEKNISELFKKRDAMYDVLMMIKAKVMA
jgi:hypothetical protein